MLEMQASIGRIALLMSIHFVLSLSQVISFEPSSGVLQLSSRSFGPSIHVAANDYNGTVRAVQDLALDFGRATGRNATMLLHDRATDLATGTAPKIIVGTTGSSTLIDDSISSGKINVSSINGKWESYIQVTVEDPFEGVSKALVVAGSDMRGTIYGLYDISETIGVLPYYFWADVPFKQKDAIYALPTTKVQGPPSVKYRGFFINDEESALMVWANTRFPTSAFGCPFTHTFYQHVFELLLRLKANFLWPGMKKQCGFYADDPLNGAEATRYGIFVGTSHQEPMATSCSEQLRDVKPFDWLTNRANVQSFFERGVERSRNFSNVWTLGMRGDGDRENEAYTAEMIEEIVEWQQGSLESGLDKDLSDIPQARFLYKEVGKYWQASMNVSEDVTPVWTDDNFGNLNRVPIGDELERSGGARIYYHFQYVGAPRSWRWGNTVQNVKTWEQMHLAYERGAREIWVTNVGDIKPLEVPTSHFMAMAYDMSKFATPDSTRQWLARFAVANYYSGLGEQIADLLTEFGLLAGRRKWELYNADGQPFAFSTLNYEETQINLQRWDDLVANAQEIYERLGSLTRPAFFETVLYPILSGYHVVQLYSYYDIAKHYKWQGRVSTNTIAAKCRAAFGADAALTQEFHTMLDGRWNSMAREAHIGQRDFGLSSTGSGKMPPVAYINEADVAGLSIVGVAFEGLNMSLPGDGRTTQLLPIERYLPEDTKRWVDVFARQNGTFDYTISSNASFVSFSPSSGTITAAGANTDVRSVISVNWEAAPAGITNVELKVIGGQETVDLLLPVHNFVPLPGLRPRHIEGDGAVSIEASHHSFSTASSYITIPAYGRTRAGVKRWPTTAPSITAPDGPRLTYNFYTFTDIENANVTMYLSQTGNVDPDRPLRYAFAIDGGALTVVQPVPTYSMGTNPVDWTSVVKDGVRKVKSPIKLGEAGAHQLHVWLLEPEVVLTKIVIDLGGERQSYLGPPESYREV